MEAREEEEALAGTEEEEWGAEEWEVGVTEEARPWLEPAAGLAWGAASEEEDTEEEGAPEGQGGEGELWEEVGGGRDQGREAAAARYVHTISTVS